MKIQTPDFHKTHGRFFSGYNQSLYSEGQGGEVAMVVVYSALTE